MGDKFVETLVSKCSSYGQQSTPFSSPACYFQKEARTAAHHGEGGGEKVLMKLTKCLNIAGQHCI